MPDLNLPTPGVTPGPEWATRINSAFGIVNSELEGRLSPSGLQDSITEAAAELNPTALSDNYIAIQARTSGTQTDNALLTKFDRYVIRKPVQGVNVDDHLDSELAIAKSGRYQSVVLPFWDDENPAVAWQLNRSHELWGGGVSYWFAPIKQTNPLQRGFVVPTGADRGVIHFVDLEGTKATLQPGNTIPIGSPLLGSSGLDVNASYWTITGQYRSWRSGVNVGVENTSTDLTQRFNNRVDITVSDNDFGLTYYRQVGSSFRVSGSYIRTLYSPDEPHLIYGTQGYSRDCVIERAYAENSPEGFPVIAKANEGLRIDEISVFNCAGILNIVNARGTTNVGLLRGRQLSTVGVLQDGTRILQPAFVNFISQPWTYPWYPVRIEEFDLDLVSGIESSRLRAVSIDGSAEVSVNKVSISYELNEVSNSQGLITVFGPSNIGSISIFNRGTGGIRGLWYRASDFQVNARHVLRNAPVMRGVAEAVRVDDNINVSIPYQDQFVTAFSYPPVSTGIAPFRGVTSPTPALNTRGNRWYSFPQSGQYRSLPLTLNRELCYPLILQRQLKISDIALAITTAASGAVVRVAVRSANSDGTPGRLIYDFGTVSAAATGEATATVPSGPITLPPGGYYLSVTAQGGAPSVGSVDGTNLVLGTPTALQSLQGQIYYRNDVTGTPDNVFVETGFSNSSGCPRVGFKNVE